MIVFHSNLPNWYSLSHTDIKLCYANGKISEIFVHTYGAVGAHSYAPHKVNKGSRGQIPACPTKRMKFNKIMFAFAS